MLKMALQQGEAVEQLFWLQLDVNEFSGHTLFCLPLALDSGCKCKPMIGEALFLCDVGVDR